MRKVLDQNENYIGYFNGTTVFDKNEAVLYRVLDIEIYAPVVSVGLNNQESHNAGLGLIGELKGNTGLSMENEVLFILAG